MKGLIKLGLTISLIYLTLGDSILPHAYGNKSQELRGNINQYLISLFPNQELATLKKRTLILESIGRENVASPSHNL